MLIAPFFVLPFTPPPWAADFTSAPPTLWLLLTLAVAVGAPLTAVCAAGLEIQDWYASARPNRPYVLYAVSGLGGLLTLSGYPLVIEPEAEPVVQARWWTAAYALFVVLLVVTGLPRWFRASRAGGNAPDAVPSSGTERISWMRRARWLGLAFVPSSVMLGVTARVSTDSASIPLVWTVPLGLYLATFIAAFAWSRRRWTTLATNVASLSAVAAPWALHLIGRQRFTAETALCLCLVVISGLACHGALAQNRPDPRHRTGFLWTVSLGAALAGAFNCLLAPSVLQQGAELPLAVTMLVGAPLLMPRRSNAKAASGPAGREIPVKIFVISGPLLVLATFLRFGGVLFAVALAACCLPWLILATSRPRAMAAGAALTTAGLFWYQAPENGFQRRTFFGDYQIYDSNGWQVLSDGATVRGYQYATAPLRNTPVSYYGSPGPLGDLFAAYGRRNARVAIVGAGTGVEASYGHPGQRMDFYDADRVALDIMMGTFTYLNDSKAGLTAVLGEARRALGNVPDRSYGLIVIDAFMSGAVPTHLLTREALGTYVRKLRPGGVIVCHLTPRNLDLAPMLRATARSAGLASITGHGRSDARHIHQASTWVAVARSESDLKPLKARGWHDGPANGPVWTDAYISPFGLLRSR